MNGVAMSEYPMRINEAAVGGFSIARPGPATWMVLQEDKTVEKLRSDPATVKSRDDAQT
jgi:hypothetical protein